LAPDGIETAHKAWMRGINCPQTSAAGRLFDAAAMLICGTACVSYEAQGPMQLEALCRRAGTAMPLPLAEDEAGVLRSDWAPLLSLLPDQRLAAPIRAELFHSSMARIVLDQAVALRQRHSFAGVGLAGGVFQNRLLTEQAARLLRFAGFEVRLHRQLPSNDAALSFGQAAEYAARDRHTAR
jgi:hydrogenase maturation protein HypF